MANSYYNNNLVDGDTLSESDLEEIETGFGSVETAMNLRVTKPGTPVLNHLLAMDASGEGVDSGVEASGGVRTIRKKARWNCSHLAFSMLFRLAGHPKPGILIEVTF